jgi:inward rectifier potassium channel
VAIIKPFEGVPTLMFRVGNQRRNFILETSVRVALLRRDMVDGNMMRRFYDVPLVRKSSLVFALTWLVMHRIDEASPLYGVDANAFQAGTDELVVLLTGTDASVIQPVHARHAYTASQIMFDHDFADVVGTGDDGRNQIDYRRFHDVVPRVAAN